MKKKIYLNKIEKEGISIEKQKKLTNGRPTGSRLVRIKNKSRRKKHLITKEDRDKVLFDSLERLFN